MANYQSIHTGSAIDLAVSTYLSKAEAISTYLNQTNAARIYLTQNDAINTFLTQTNAANTYVGLTNNQTISGLKIFSNNVNINSGYLEIWPNQHNFREGIRIHSYDSWSDIVLCGNDMTSSEGISANSWFIGNNNGDLHLNRNGSTGTGNTNFSSISNAYWRLRSNMSGAISGTTRSVLHIYGQTYGNTASELQSGVAGILRYGDGGPQITFDSTPNPGGGQAGALIFSDHDSVATGVSFTFCTNQNNSNYGGDCSVIAPIFLTRNYFINTNILGGSWIVGTRNASFRVAKFTTAGAGGFYQAWFSGKTASGSWSFGALSGNNDFYFSFGTDANYNSNTNTTVNARITAAGAFTNASKREYKENIDLFEGSCLDIINSIEICSFNMKGDPNKDFRVGFIADDTDPIVSGRNQDVMDLQNCIGVLIKAVQELSEKVDNLENIINEK